MGSLNNGLPVARSHTMATSSSPPEISRFPSGLKSSQNTRPTCPDSVNNSLPVAISQSLTVFSLEPVDAIWVSSGLNLTSKMPPVCPRKVRDNSPVAASQILTNRSSGPAPVTINFPLGLKAPPWMASPEGKAKVYNSWPFRTSQTFTVPSLLLVNKRVPSGLK